VKVLVADDDPGSLLVARAAVERSGHDCLAAADGDEAWALVREHQPDVVVTDWMMPGMDGLALCRSIRTRETDLYTYIVLLTSQGSRDDVLAGLEAGADDYVAKPFKAKELIARIKTRLRRSPEEVDQEMLRIGDLVINVDSHTVKRNGSPIQLTPLEFDLLLALARRPWQVFSREVLLEQVWGYRHAADTRLVNVHVQRLRSKIERDPEHPEIVVTVRGIGYKAGEPT
jgi:two-component system response regulator MtrA